MLNTSTTTGTGARSTRRPADRRWLRKKYSCEERSIPVKHIHKLGRPVHIASFLALVTLVTGLVLNAPTAHAADAGVVYHGGPVVAGDMKVYVIFWEPPGSFVSTGYHRLLKRYFKDVGDSGLYEINEQYADTSGHAPTGAVLADAFVDASPYPSAPFILDSDIRREVVHAMNVNGWKPGIGHVFFVFTALNSIICSPFGTCSAPASSLCAYHFGFGTVGGPVLYAAMPYAGNSLAGCYGLADSPNRDIDADAEINLASHEQMEIATDPEATGWFGPGGIFDEIGDKCAGVFGPLDAKGADVVFKGHAYIVQEEWDNTVSGCALTGP